MSQMTLEQRRAADAWQRCERYQREHINISKGLPALIMNSGLMQVLAFCHQKGDKHEQVATDLRCWLGEQFKELPADGNFNKSMEALLNASPLRFQQINSEAFAWLKWLRQLAAARGGV